MAYTEMERSVNQYMAVMETDIVNSCIEVYAWNHVM